MLRLIESKRSIRKIADPPRLAVYDVLGAITGQPDSHSRVIFQRLRDAHPEVAIVCRHAKMPGNRPTPVVEVRDVALLLALLPSAASAFRKELLEIAPEDELLDAEAILRERGCSQEQVSRMSGELGKDLLLVAKSEGRKIPTADKQFGVEIRTVKQYHRGADAKLIDDVLESFRQRPLWQKIMANDPTTSQRQQLLAEHGRGRKKQRTT